MKPIQKPSKSFKIDASDIWDDSDLIVSEETSNNITRQSLNKTRQFKNTMKNNKGKVKPEDLSDYVLEKGLHQYSSSVDIQMESFDDEFESESEEEAQEKILKPMIVLENVEKTACTIREGANILLSLRQIPSNELLKVIL
ncbi:unnamed protein product [Moneuplotes crassus]|uniref:Uncharacterized protein n=1 Tax=Euplotes crassus TaxID=5936 RepID=A0AAD1XFE2_EUPCR|nr:unnamed protein product [Moneuplotes crassus]